MKSVEGIKSGLVSQDTPMRIARKIYLSYSTEIFKDKEDTEFYIKDNISSKFNIPFSSIEVVGSSKTGFSFFKDKKFEPGKSDLDIAIISLPLYSKFSQIAHKKTKGYTDLTYFIPYKGERTDKAFLRGLSDGFLNPFFMPNCPERNEWLSFFNTLSNSYYDLFKNINGGIYNSEYYFEFKQEECINQYINNPGKYDEVSSTL